MRLRRPIIILAALAATALTAPVAAGSDATVSATLTAAPDPVTVGHTAALTTTFTNTGPVSVHDVELRLSIPDGSFLQVAPADANCVLEHGNTEIRDRELAGRAQQEALPQLRFQGCHPS